LAVSLTSASDSDAVANVRTGDTHVVEERRRRLEHLGHVGVVGPFLAALAHSCHAACSVWDQPWQRGHILKVVELRRPEQLPF
jgi:hypothetical protein